MDVLLTGLDHARLSSLLFRPRAADALSADLADAGRALLDSASIVDVGAIGPDVVTMRSTVVIDRPGLGETSVCLVYPHESDPLVGCISVFTPMGLALLGARCGQQVTWRGPDGREHRATLLRLVYQPEAAGDHLR